MTHLNAECWCSLIIHRREGDSILALTQNARHKLWSLQSNKHSLEKVNINMQ